MIEVDIYDYKSGYCFEGFGGSVYRSDGYCNLLGEMEINPNQIISKEKLGILEYSVFTPFYKDTKFLWVFPDKELDHVNEMVHKTPFFYRYTFSSGYGLLTTEDIEVG